MQSVDHPVIGFRTWKYGGRGQLKSVVQDFSWEKRNEAKCMRPFHLHRAPAPAEGCGCGLYAFHDLVNASTYGAEALPRCGEPQDIVGIVRGWGNLRVHKDGWRAQHAEILAIIEPSLPESPFVLGATALAEHQRAVGYAHEVAKRYDLPVIPGRAAGMMACEFGSFVPKKLRPASSIFAGSRGLSASEEIAGVCVVLAPILIACLAQGVGQRLVKRWWQKRKEA